MALNLNRDEHNRTQAYPAVASSPMPVWIDCGISCGKRFDGAIIHPGKPPGNRVGICPGEDRSVTAGDCGLQRQWRADSAGVASVAGAGGRDV